MMQQQRPLLCARQQLASVQSYLHGYDDALTTCV
jgi:hypothetical protein